ncbi:MAG: homoserine dehydrogenase [Spirochaetales bacterium]|jgi:homoserine dehydrogenase|nr:homoserine dehydrogenase [Spirochaetales bacterium]
MRKKHIDIGIAILGCGTVGGATALALIKDKELLLEKTGLSLNLKYIVDKNFDNAVKLGLNKKLFETKLGVVLNDPDISIIVELVGGLSVAKDFIEKALLAKKHVVTANKALLAHAGPALLSLARKNHVTLAFEASCGGGIPIIRALCDGLIANRIDALYGIVNGTCNYILTQMIDKGQSYKDALAGAQAGGLAEANPGLDVSGMDSAHKLAILASLAFGQKINLEAIPVTGIDCLQSMDVEFGCRLGYVVKLLAVASRLENGLALRVHPAFISREHPLAWVSGPFNAISVYGHKTGHTMYYGRGAGGSPTASAIVSDIVSCALGTQRLLFKNLGIWSDKTKKAKQLPFGETVSRFYLRFMVNDTAGVLAKITASLGKNGISIASVLQKEIPEESGRQRGKVPVVIVTHSAKEKNVRKALGALRAARVVVEDPVCLNIVDECKD